MEILLFEMSVSKSDSHSTHDVVSISWFMHSRVALLLQFTFLVLSSLSNDHHWFAYNEPWEIVTTCVYKFFLWKRDKEDKLMIKRKGNENKPIDQVTVASKERESETRLFFPVILLLSRFSFHLSCPFLPLIHSNPSSLCVINFDDGGIDLHTRKVSFSNGMNCTKRERERTSILSWEGGICCEWISWKMSSRKDRVRRKESESHVEKVRGI